MKSTDRTGALTRRRFVEASLSTLATLSAGTGRAQDAAAPQLPPAPAPMPGSGIGRPPGHGPEPHLPPAPAPIESATSAVGRLAAEPGANAHLDADASSERTNLPPGPYLTLLSVRSVSAGQFPYAATGPCPTQGQLPRGAVFISPDDEALQTSVLSTHGDGSAAVVVVAGRIEVAASADRFIRLQVGAGPASHPTAHNRNQSTAPPLTAAAVSTALQSVRVDFGPEYGRIDLNRFDAPERVWWANANTVCARYRAAAPRAGATALEAVVDVHAFADGRALVEVVVENAKLACPAPGSTPPTRYEAPLPKPAPASYAKAVVQVNGRTAATVDGNAAPEGHHPFGRAWYASAWVGGDPGLRVTQHHTDLQRHPLFFRCDQPGADMALYADDHYTPWSTGRHRATGMGGGGDHASIGPLPQWEARFLQTGDWRAARAVEASALALLGYNINVRDSGTGLVPAASQLVKRTQTSSERNFPGDGADAMGWELAHQPAAGLMAFACRPSPVFIEQAQKIAVWNATRHGQSTITTGWAGAAVLADNTTGVLGFGGHQVRGFAWGLRNLVQATFLSPDGSDWKAGGRYWVERNRVYLDAWRTSPRAKLNTVWESGVDGDLHNHAPKRAGFATAIWMQHYLVTELHKTASLRLLAGNAQHALEVTADWIAAQPVRWINEQTEGGWRCVPYQTAFGRSATTIDSLPDWGQQMAWATDHAAPPGRVGPWVNVEGRSYDGPVDGHAGAYFPSYLWAALVAAVERDLPGASTAWQTVQRDLDGLGGWRRGFAGEPRWGAAPRKL